MNKYALIMINIALALAVSIFIYQILPYAAAIACGEIKPLPNCQPLTQIELYSFTVAPFVIVGSIIFFAVRLWFTQPKLSRVLLSILPVIATLLGVYIIVFSTTQP